MIGKKIGNKNIASLHQVHGALAVIVHEPTSRTLQADALATDQLGLSLTIRTADCQSVVLFDPIKNALCLMHAGWKGMRQKMLTSAVKTMQEEWKTNPADLIVGAGPSLCTSCAEFTDPTKEAPELSAFFHNRCIDLRASADAELVSLGILKSHIDRSPDCTRCHPEHYWTYRGGDREAVENGWCNVMVGTLKGM